MARMTERIKVVQIITGLGPGGAERLLLDMMARFDTSRFDMKLASIVDNLSGTEVYGHQDTPVEVFDLGGISGPISVLRLRRFMQRFAPDVVHAHMFHALMATYASTRLQSRIPAICFTSHQSRYAPGRRQLVRMTRSWRSADILLLRDQHPPMNARSTWLIPNGVPVHSAAPERKPWPPERPVRLVAVGRLADQKDPLGMVRSFAAAKLTNAILDFVGSGPLEPEVRGLVQSLGLQDRVRLLGVRSDVRALMQGADIFVMHSKFEGMPMALLEAGAEAMPVIVTPVGSCPDVIGPDDGWLAEPSQFASVLARVVSDPPAAILAGKRLHARIVAQFSIDATVRAHEAMYVSLVSQQL